MQTHSVKTQRLARISLALAIHGAVSLELSANETIVPETTPNILVTDKQGPGTSLPIGGKLSGPARELPVSFDALDSTVIDRARGATLGELISNAAAVQLSPGEGGLFSEFIIRGFGDAAVFRNGINDSFGRPPGRSLANVERVEVIKGPLGALYGPGEPGGSVNFVTKKPQSEKAAEIVLGIGAFSAFDLTFDVTGPLSANGPDYRLIASRQQSNTFRDFVKTNRTFLNPSVHWQIGRALALSINLEYLSDRRLLDPGIAALGNGRFAPLEHFYGDPASGSADIDSYSVQVAAAYSVSNDWQLEFDISGQQTRLDGKSLEPDGIMRRNTGLLLERVDTRRRDFSQALIAQVELSGDVDGGEFLKHSLRMGSSITGVNEEVRFDASGDELTGLVTPISRPTYGVQGAPLAPERNSYEQTRLLSGYVQDLISIGRHWRLLGAIRLDHIDQSGSDLVSNSRFSSVSTDITTRVGIVYLPSDNLSLYTSYAESIDPNEGLTPSGNSLVPTEGRSVEFGVKWDPYELPASIAMSAYAIEQSNVTSDAPGSPGFETQTAEQTALGTELELNFAVTRWLDIGSRYLYTDAQILNDPLLPDGTVPLNVAKHRFQFYARSQLSLIRPQDTFVGISLEYMGERQGSIDADELQVRLPHYVRADMILDTQISKNWGAQLRVENVTNADYIAGSQSDALRLTPGAPLTVRGQLSFSF